MKQEESMAIKRTLVALVLAVAVAVIASATLRAQAGAAAVPFKLGAFEQGGRTFLGLVLRDAQIVDIARANTAYESANASAPKLTAPADMKQLITRYDSEWRARLAAIARTIPATGTASSRIPRPGRWGPAGISLVSRKMAAKSPLRSASIPLKPPKGSSRWPPLSTSRSARRRKR